jgi:transketolase
LEWQKIELHNIFSMNNYSKGNCMDCIKLENKSRIYRQKILEMIQRAGMGHTGGSLSCIDILNVLYNSILNVTPENFSQPDHDRFILSKGHSVEALYTVLADRGFFDPSELESYCQFQSTFIGHPTRKVHGIEHNTGGLGHGLPVAVGLAIAAKMDGSSSRVFALLGDGELAEGSVWEAAMAAAHYQLDNLIVIIDRNGLQISGPTEEVMSLEPLAGKFQAFGFTTRTVDGHDLEALENNFHEIPFQPGKPSLLLAKTIKGKGFSFMEGQVSWHHHVPTEQEVRIAIDELNRQEFEQERS